MTFSSYAPVEIKGNNRPELPKYSHAHLQKRHKALHPLCPSESVLTNDPKNYNIPLFFLIHQDL